MAVLDGLITEHLDERKHDLHIVKALLEFLVGGVLLGLRRQLQAVLEELLNTFLHTKDLARDLEPRGLLPLCDSLSDLEVESVEFVELFELALGLLEAGVRLVRKSEKLLARSVRFVLTVMDGELLLEVL